MKTFDRIVGRIASTLTISAFFVYYNVHQHDFLKAYFGDLVGQIHHLFEGGYIHV